MGLDNIPHQYPCKTQGTAVLVARQGRDGEQLMNDDGTPVMSIDCKATQECGGCPWKTAMTASGLPDDGRVYGMFGTDCWYRGKYGNYLLEEVGLYDETEGVSFYGALGDGTHKSPHECVILADSISGALDDVVEDAEVRRGLEYAEWYLRWAAEHTEGLDCWY